MITHETRMVINGYIFRFRVFDDSVWIVSIDKEEEFGCSSNDCRGCWDRGLGEALAMFNENLDSHERWKLYQAIVDEHIIVNDAQFIAGFTRASISEVDIASFDEIEEEWEKDNLFIDLY